jgi:Family of unknown function (DUF6353)
MKLVSEAVRTGLGRTGLLTQKNSPQILFGVGIAGSIASTVLACRATLKLEETLEKTRVDLKRVKVAEKKDNGDEYSDRERQQDTSVVYMRGAYNVVKLYGPAIIVGGISIAALTQSQNILTKRNAALTAAYAALDKGFREYRARVVDKYGEDQDREFRYGSEKVEIINEETGRKKTVTRVGPDTPSVYARFFDPLSPSWSKDPETNFIFLRAQQNYSNDLLRSRGHVFLNEVYDMLGIPRTKAGSVVGWLMSPNPGETDNYVNFGIFDDNEKVIDFVNGREASILLDFNVDGVIYDKIDTPTEARSWQMGN